MKKYNLIFLIIISLAVFMPAEASLSGDRNCELEYSSERLSVNIVNAPLKTVAGIIEEKADIKFLFSEEDGDRIISINFQSLPIKRAITRILSKFNHSIVLRADGTVKKIIIIENSKTASSSSLSSDTTELQTNIPISSPSNEEGMIITYDSDEMELADSPDEMIVTYDSEDMVIADYPDEMIITDSTDTMEVG